MTVRRGAQTALIGGLAVSLGANVLAAETPGVGWVAAGLPSVVLAVCAELMIKAPVSGALSWLRWTVTVAIGAIAGWVSYWHMVEVTLAAGERVEAAHLLPLTGDGMVVVAMATLWDLGRQPATQAPGPAPRIEVADPRPAGPVGVSSTTHLAGGPAVPSPKKPARKPAVAKTGAGSGAREKALAVIKADPGATNAMVVEQTGVSLGTVKNARRHLRNLTAVDGDPTEPTSTANDPSVNGSAIAGKE